MATFNDMRVKLDTLFGNSKLSLINVRNTLYTISELMKNDDKAKQIIEKQRKQKMNRRRLRPLSFFREKNTSFNEN